MKNNNSLSFKNRRFIQVEIMLILFAIFFIIVQAIFFDNNYIRTLIVVWLVGNFLTPLPYKYTIEGDKLVLKFFLKRNKSISIADIQEVDVSKHNCLSFTYIPVGFEYPTYINLSVKDSEVIEIQEELTKRNSNIEVLFN